MEKELNLAEILKDCPKGTKLYSIIHGEVEFVRINNDYITNYPIIYKYQDDDGTYCTDSTTIDGKFDFPSNGECILFPSKDQRDWSKFKIEPEMIDGEIYTCYFHGDKYAFIYKQHLVYKTGCYVGINLFTGILVLYFISNNNAAITSIYKATNEDKEKLLLGLHRYDFEWDEKKKELVKVEPKFDISTLKPFDKVLVRDFDNDMWRCSFYEWFAKDMDYPFTTMRCSFKQCIPYNDETKHLVGSTEMPPKKYINWEEEL